MCRKISIPRKDANIINTRQYKNYDKEEFRFDLNQIFQFEQYDKGDPNYVWNDWKTYIEISLKEKLSKQGLNNA